MARSLPKGPSCFWGQLSLIIMVIPTRETPTVYYIGTLDPMGFRGSDI